MNNTLFPQNLAFIDHEARSWPARPFQLVTLLDMLRFDAHWFVQSLGWLNLCLNDASKGLGDKERGRHSYPTDDEVKRLESALKSLDKYCEIAGLKRAQEKIADIRQDLDWRETYSYVTLETIHRAILELERTLCRDLDEQVFMVLANSDIKYYEQKQLFGPDVFTNFPSTRNNVAEAGNCYATGRYTACVFHCMRVVVKRFTRAS